MSRQLRDPRERVTVTIPAWVAALRDGGIQAMVVLFVLAAAGFLLMGLAWHGGARYIYVPLQIPWLVSGGMIGLAMVGVSLGAWNIHLGRRYDALHRHEVDQMVRDVSEMCEQIRNGDKLLPGRRSRR
jgi:vacuolar-type H+-ATPase subunit I/STV1